MQSRESTLILGENNELSNIELALKICQKLDFLFPAENGVPYESLIQYVTDRRVMIIGMLFLLIKF